MLNIYCKKNPTINSNSRIKNQLIRDMLSKSKTKLRIYYCKWRHEKYNYLFLFKIRSNLSKTA